MMVLYKKGWSDPALLLLSYFDDGAAILKQGREQLALKGGGEIYHTITLGSPLAIRSQGAV
jgi:hypothetical protein